MTDKTLRYDAKFEVIKSSIKEINPSFSTCDILVAYEGKNRNWSDISKPVFEEAHYSLYGVPIVGEWIKLEDDQNKETWGSHGGRLIISDKGIKFEQTTKCLGFVTKEAVENAEWVLITEKNGIDKHNYLKLSGCILWTQKYEECNSILDENFGQSMEIKIIEGVERSDGFLQIDKFIYQALCILGNQVEPCFESASIGRHYAFDEFKRELTVMLDEYKKSQNLTKEENHNMKKRIVEILSAFKFTNTVNKEVSKYEILAIRDDAVDVIDREADYKLYTIPYSKNENDEVIVEYDNKAEKSIVAGEKSEVDFNIKAEITDVTADMIAFAISTHESDVISDLNQRYSKLEADYNALKAESTKDKAILAEYAKAKSDAEFELHKTEVDKKIDEYQAKMGQFSEYLIYRTKVDYSKTVDQVDVDMLILLGKFNKGQSSTFSYVPQATGVNEDKNTIGNSRYGNLFDKIQK